MTSAGTDAGTGTATGTATGIDADPGTDPAPPPRARWRAGWRQRAERLFVAAPATPVRRRGLAVGVGAGVVVAGTAVSLLRHPGTVALDTVYAEDGTVFLAEAADGPVAALFSSYAGYLHLAPRLLGTLAAAFPAPAAAAVLAISAAAVTAGLAVLVYVASAGHLPSPLARVLVAAPVVVAPLAQQEVPNSIANLHWPALYAVFWLLIWSPPGRVGRVVAPAVVALTALSDILVVAFLPLAIVRVLAQRDRYSAALAALLTLGVAGQLTGLLTGSSSREVSLDPLQPASGYILRAVPAALWGDRWLPEAGADPRRLALAALAWLLLAVVVVIAARGLSQPRWVLAVTAGVHSVALYTLPVVLTGVAPQRYALTPALLVVTAIVAMLHPPTRVHPPPASSSDQASPPTSPARTRHAAPLATLAILYTAVCVLNLRVETPRELGPDWHSELERSRTECLDPGSRVAEMPVTPADADWIAVLPCDYLIKR